MPKSELKIVGGDKEWYLNGKRHREDGPAVERAGGTKMWYLNGNLHREDGPAVEWATGTKYWFLNGKRHREDGPAVEGSDGNKMWYLNGDELTKEEFELAMDIKRTKDKKRAILYRTSKIAKVCYDVMGI